jgi:hypothetical protein
MIAQWLRSKAFTCENKGLGIEFYGEINSDIGMDSDVDIGSLPISE